MTLLQQVERYIEFRKSLGHKFVDQERYLLDYATHATSCGDSFVCSGTVYDWASKTPSTRTAQDKLRYACGLARFLHAEDGRHEVPNSDFFGKKILHRPTPHLLSWIEVRQIMDAALDLPPIGSMTPLTFHHILGLMAATGLRRSEAIGLLLSDLTADGLLIRNAKNGKQRFIPLDASVHHAMDAYLRERTRSGGSNEHLFVLSTGHPISIDYLSEVFRKLVRQVGLRGKPGLPGPRLHDLRHSFASRALESMLSTERPDVSRHMLALSTYLGHSKATDTYWYLEATPVLLNQVSDATERLHEERKND